MCVVLLIVNHFFLNESFSSSDSQDTTISMISPVQRCRVSNYSFPDLE